MDLRMPIDFIGIISDRLVEAGAPLAERNAAIAVLAVVSSDLATQSLACRSPVNALAARLRMDQPTFIGAMKLLTAAGAVTVGLHHRERRIFLVPPGGRASPRPRQYAPPATLGPAVPIDAAAR
jgi:hypothetical protein